MEYERNVNTFATFPSTGTSAIALAKVELRFRSATNRIHTAAAADKTGLYQEILRREDARTNA